MSDIDVLRRIAERGLRFNQPSFLNKDADKNILSRNVDLWQNILDEIERLDKEKKDETNLYARV